MKYHTDRPVEYRAVRGTFGYQNVYFLEYRIPPQNLKEKIFGRGWNKIYEYHYLGGNYDMYTPYDDWYVHWTPIMWRDESYSRQGFNSPEAMLEYYKTNCPTFGDIVKIWDKQDELCKKDKEQYAEYHQKHNNRPKVLY